MLATLKELEKPLTTGDFALQRQHFGKILEKLQPLKLKSLDELEFDARTRLFTALLRASRQPAVEDAEKEAARKELFYVVGQIWRALADERRAALAFAESGRTEPAVKMLQKAGEWQEVAELHERQGRPREAAQLYEQHAEHARAAKGFEAAGDGKGWLRNALLAGDVESARRAARAVPLPVARELLLKHRHGDLLLDLLASSGRWEDIAHLYEKAEQWGDAAQAYERAKKTFKAAELFRRAGDEANATRLIDAEVEARRARNDLVGAGQLLVKFGLFARAAALLEESRPELSFKWLQQGGLDAEAQKLGRRHAQAALDAGRTASAAEWLERLGETARAAELFASSGQHPDALRLYEQLGEWEKAGEQAARAGA
ncbi:MAG: hypothetical protein ACK4N5_11235, partial [Myxococcales bacterium]